MRNRSARADTVAIRFSFPAQSGHREGQEEEVAEDEEETPAGRDNQRAEQPSLRAHRDGCGRKTWLLEGSDPIWLDFDQSKSIPTERRIERMILDKNMENERRGRYAPRVVPKGVPGPTTGDTKRL